MNNITEIVFGETLYYNLSKTEFSKNNKIIKFDTLFSICDLSNIDKMILKYEDNFCKLINFELTYNNLENINSIEDKIKEIELSIKNKNKIRIWTTQSQIDSYLMFIFMCNYFSNINHDLYVVFSDEYDKECYSPTCMNEKELFELQNYEHKLTKKQIDKYSQEWEEIVKINSEIRIIQNGSVSSVSYDYYNNIILNRLKELGEVMTTKLIASLIGDINLFDMVYIYLINRLIQNKKIIVTKEEKCIFKSFIKINDDFECNQVENN